MLSRRESISAAATAALLLGSTPAAAATSIIASEYWANKGDVKLYIYRKRQAAAKAAATQPVLFLVHGSSFSGRGGYDLEVPGAD